MSEKPGENSVVTITPAEAAELVSQAGGRSLHLDHLTRLDVATAAVLAECEDELFLHGLTQIDVPVAEALSNLQGGILGLDGLTQIDVPVAEALAQQGIWLSLAGLTQLDASIAEVLVKHIDDLNLDGLTHLDASVAEALSKFSGTRLSLDGLTHLDASVAEALSKFSGGELTLNGLTHLDASVAEALSKFSGYHLGLKGLTQIDRETASHLRSLLLRGKLTGSGYIDNPLFDDLFLGQDEEELDIQRIDIAHWQPLFEKHPNFKDLVVEESAEISQFLKESGVENPERFHNLNAGRGGEEVIGEVLQFIAGQSSGSGMVAFSELFRNRTRKDFEGNPEFMAVYLDETLQALSDHLNHMIAASQRQLKRSSDDTLVRRRAFFEDKIADPSIRDRAKRRYRSDLKALLSQDMQKKSSALEDRIGQAQALLSKMDSFHLKRQGEVSYALGSRSTRDLTLGDKCSDCTSAKIHGMNFWTVPTWLTDPGHNFLLQYDEEGKLAHKFGMVWELKAEGGKQVPILTIDSLELANGQKNKAGMSEGPSDPEKEKKLMEEAVTFIRNWARDMGLDPNNLHASTISNTGVAELDEEYPKKEIAIAKLGALDASQRILENTNPDYDGEVKVYLQSLVEAQAQDNQPIDENILEEVDREADFARVEGCIDQFLQSDSHDTAKIREFLGLARTDANEAARKMRIFLVMQAQGETKKALCIDGKRIDVFLNSRGHSFESYLKAILGQTEVSRGTFVKAELFHLVPRND